MTETERDTMLARLDERTINIYTLVEKQEQHLAKQNDTLDRHEKVLTLLDDCAHMLDIKCNENRKLTFGMWGVNGFLVLTMIGLVIQHLIV